MAGVNRDVPDGSRALWFQVWDFLTGKLKKDLPYQAAVSKSDSVFHWRRRKGCPGASFDSRLR